MAHLNQVSQDHVPVGLEDGEGDEEDELGTVVVGPEDFPQTQHLFEREFAFECDEYPS